MRRYVMYSLCRKIGIFLIAMAVLSAGVFFISRSIPGNPLQSYYGEQAERMTSEEQLLARERLGLDQPVYVQYAEWLEQAGQGDFGVSLKYKVPAREVVREFLPNTLVLGGISFGLVFILAILLALICARYEGTWVDKLICRLGNFLYYLPAFWLGLLCILVFTVDLGWLPGSGAYDPGHSNDIGNRALHLILPVAVMVMGHVWYYAYMIRNKLLDEVRQEYVLLAKAKGFSRRYILVRHCLRNVAPTIVTFMAVSVNHVLGGTYIVEAVFSYPGIGNLAIESTKYHDYNLLMLIILITGAAVIVSGLIAQAVNERLDPRMKAREGGTAWIRIHPSK